MEEKVVGAGVGLALVRRRLCLKGFGFFFSRLTRFWVLVQVRCVVSDGHVVEGAVESHVGAVYAFFVAVWDLSGGFCFFPFPF